MLRAILVLLAVVACAVLALAAFIYVRDVSYVVDSYRYRLTVNFMVDGKPLSASGVVQETIHSPPCILLEQTCGRISIKGDAIPVSFPNGRTAFVLLEVVDENRGATVGLFPSSALPKASPTGKMNAWMHKDFEVRTKLLPTIVFFADTGDPSSIIIVEPTNIAEIGGPSAVYQNAIVTVTDEPVTRGLENRLPWILTYKNNLDLKSVDFFRYMLMENLVSYLRRDDL
ncbi:hypothetical protein [Rhizobium sp. P44RR-XXIV]|uniref:hypothetical protein n=1 Tax=Rhizobium sp. P44RR-XXIV TaxID=1921145 RepID=UPI00098789C7|nr:hypothetical protein [Rhizobium sp. P44RR-XXIV]TIX90514.1 hypothetical protein BSK43_014685 [Rhizobium sp. P44RR-XXIV]